MQFLSPPSGCSRRARSATSTASDKEVKDSFEQQKKQSFPKEKDYEKFLETSGQTEADLLYRVKLSVLTNKLQQSIIKDEGKVTDKEIEDYYEKNKQRFAQPETRDLLVILNPKKAKADAALQGRRRRRAVGARWPSSTPPTTPPSHRAASSRT